MAKIEMGILGGFSGRVGTVVGYYRRGGWFVRAYQPHIKDRKSAAQLEQRSRFKAMIQFASPATPVLRMGMKKAAAAQGLTEGNIFLKINHRSFQNNLNIQIDYPKLQFSKGSLPGIANLQYAVDEQGVLRVRWEREGGVRGDKVLIYIYCEAAGPGLAAEGRRGDGYLQLLLPEAFRGGDLHLWAFASNPSGNVSSTQYISSTAPTDEKNDIVNAEATHNAVPAAGLEADCTQLATPPSVATVVGDG